ncbi:LamG-like jellyroll fold domain-containing protein [Algibacter miyuki]|uniref:LamG-like jellyroll fold domain-containing protein n=1 Tax=Algibacter miyuki TaxID=1306933 RepID=A0ABV5H3E3_9FLAO|nr:LamG-like jellyroll fold domain-containing protein [Algibacter miyuki]MDN3665466.1 T9SS type A sorting domain-containing protein [Algibacter miyuki]
MKNAHKSCWLKTSTMFLLTWYALTPALSLSSNSFGATSSELSTTNHNFSFSKDKLLQSDNEAMVLPGNSANNKFQLYFNGETAYTSEPTLINSWQETSLMVWINIADLSNGIQFIAGQNIFNLQLNADKSISAYANNQTITSNDILNNNQWYHIAATFNANTFNLYINGVLNASLINTSGSLDADTSYFILGKNQISDSQYFQGYMDELRVFNKALTSNELQKIIFQEIENNNGIVKGAVLPKDITDFNTETHISTPLSWNYLKRYYRMDSLNEIQLNDFSKELNTESATLHNVEILNQQTAPLPFVTNQSGSLENAINHPEHGIRGTDALAYNWSIVHIKHNDVYFSGSQAHLGLIIDEQNADLEPITFTVLDQAELNISWYLNLNGTIDLKDNSQLIQGEESTLNTSSLGEISTNKAISGDIYTYNYWSSPVGQTNNSTNNNTYKLPDVIKNINFLKSGYDGGTNAIADYWIWKCTNAYNSTNSIWQHIRSTGSIKAGEGFTMKGTTNDAAQNFKIKGKPNNGPIAIAIEAGNHYLVGNPYASTLDAKQFIIDNSSIGQNNGAITGTLYFKEHDSGSSHRSSAYDGGYATYSLAGGVPAAHKGNDNHAATSHDVTSETPGQYIPMSQAFFVVAETSGTIQFNNNQRAFHIEETHANDVAKTANFKIAAVEDERPKLRIGFNSVNQIHRQLLITEDPNASSGYDWGYDAKAIDSQIDDMYWLINDENYNIQSTNLIEESTKIPLGIHTQSEGENSISVDGFEYFPKDLNVYLHDKTLGVFHNLLDSNYTIHLAAGSYLDRFEITFTDSTTLSTDLYESTQIDMSFLNSENSIVIHNPSAIYIESVQMYNMLGQCVFKLQSQANKSNFSHNVENLHFGVYILKIKTNVGIFSKEILKSK